METPVSVAKAAEESARGRQTKVGRVVSDKMTKTIIVEVERRVQEARYNRTIKRTSRFHAHDEAGVGQVQRLPGQPAAALLLRFAQAKCNLEEEG